MASGFGCMVVGPAGSGKVKKIYATTLIVNILSRSARFRRVTKEEL